MKSKSSRDRVSSSSFESRPLPPWAGRAAIIAAVVTIVGVIGFGVMTAGNKANEFDKEREAVFTTMESQLAEMEAGKGATSPDDPKLRKVAAAIAADRPSNPLMAATQFVRSAMTKPDPCDETNLRKDLLRERIALVELESMTRSPMQRKDAEVVLNRLDGNFESHRYLVFVERCGLPIDKWHQRLAAARLEDRALALRGRIAQELGQGFAAQMRANKQRQRPE